MSIAEFTGNLKTAQQHRHEARSETFESLARQVADGAALDPDEVADQLDQLERTAEELATAAQLIVDRRAWATHLGKDAELHAEHNALCAEEQSANEDLAETIRQAKFSHAQKVTPLQSRIVTIAYARDSGQTARNRLLATSPLRERLAKLSGERGALAIALQGELARQLRHALPGVATGNAQAEIARTQAKVDQLAVEIEQLEREALVP